MYDVNLARKPFWNVKAFVMVLSVLALVTIIVTYFNVSSLYRTLTGTEETKDNIAYLEGRIQTMESENLELLGEIRQVDLENFSREIQHLNKFIEERAFSWSRLLDRLELIKPYRVRVISLSPGLRNDGTVQLSMNCITEERNGMLQLIDALNHSPDFSNPVPGKMRDQESGVPEGRRFSLRVIYHPREI